MQSLSSDKKEITKKITNISQYLPPALKWPMKLVRVYSSKVTGSDKGYAVSPCLDLGEHTHFNGKMN